MSLLTINDILEELHEENNRLLNELLFAHKCVLKSLEFKEFIDLFAKQFIDKMNPNVKKRYEELSHGFYQLFDQKWANISDESPNESKTVTVTMSNTSDYPIERHNYYHTTNEDSVNDEEVCISEEETVELDVSQALRTNNRPKHICDQCGSSYEFQEVFELHIEYCCPERQSVSSESRPEYNWCDIKEEKEKEMISGQLIPINMVTLRKCNYEFSDCEEVLLEEPVTEEPAVRTENSSHKPMTRSSAKAVSEQQSPQSSNGFNPSSKPTVKQKSKPNSRGKTKEIDICLQTTTHVLIAFE